MYHIHAASSFSTTVEVYGGTKFSSIFDAQVVGVHFLEKISLRAIGRPFN
jgi:hypothetical protein